MVEAFKPPVSLDDWIIRQAFKHAYSEKTLGFVGKKYLKERVLSAVPREFIALGHTREKVGLRLSEMLANDLTQALVRECDERRIKPSQPEPTVLGNGLNPATGNEGALITGISATNTFNSASTITPGSSTTTVRKFGTGTGAAAGSGRGRGDSFQVIADKERKPVIRKTESEGDKDIFSRGGSSPQRYFPFFFFSFLFSFFLVLGITSNIETQSSRSSSVFIPPPPPPPPPPDVDTPFLPPPPPLPLDVDIPFLPFKLQHRILITLQSTLESACYDFTRKHYPDFLIRKRWDCPEAGELTHWTRGLVSEFQDNPTEAVRDADDFPAALEGINEIRDLAVHRVPVSGRGIQRLIQKTNVVLHMFDATKRIRDQINELDGVIERNIRTLLDKRRKKEDILRLELEKLEEWKRILEVREVRVIKQAENEEENIQKSFRDTVEEALGGLVYSIGASPDLENGDASDEREADHVEDPIPEHSEECFHESEGW